MTIGIIGSGNVGGTLGTRWAEGGHTVVFGSRRPEAPEAHKLAATAATGARTASLEEAAAAGEVLLLATPWPVTRSVLEGLGDLTGKIVIDATNPLLPDLSGLALDATTSGGEQVAGWARGARVVKAFNTVGYNVMAHPDFSAGRPVMFYCGDDAGAKRTVHPLIDGLGFEAIDVGALQQARLLEPFALLWISLALKQTKGREMAFLLMRR